MHAKTEIPFDRTGEPSVGASFITITAYGQDLAEAFDRHHQMKNESLMMSEPLPEKVGRRWRVTWKEDMKKLADVLSFPGRWNRRPQKKGK